MGRFIKASFLFDTVSHVDDKGSPWGWYWYGNETLTQKARSQSKNCINMKIYLKIKFKIIILTDENIQWNTLGCNLISIDIN
jgi:hypothetical protein